MHIVVSTNPCQVCNTIYFLSLRWYLHSGRSLCKTYAKVLVNLQITVNSSYWWMCLKVFFSEMNWKWSGLHVSALSVIALDVSTGIDCDLMDSKKTWLLHDWTISSSLLKTVWFQFLKVFIDYHYKWLGRVLYIYQPNTYLVT